MASGHLANDQRTRRNAQEAKLATCECRKLWFGWSSQTGVRGARRPTNQCAFPWNNFKLGNQLEVTRWICDKVKQVMLDLPLDSFLQISALCSPFYLWKVSVAFMNKVIYEQDRRGCAAIVGCVGCYGRTLALPTLPFRSTWE